MEVSEPPDRVAAAVDFTRNEHFETSAVRLQPERTPVERLVVKDAQRQSVRDDVRATRRAPLDMRGLQSEELVFYADVEVADGATTLVGAQHLAAESRTARGGGRFIGRIGDPVGGDADGGADVVVQRRGKVPVQKCLNGLPDEPGVGEQKLVERLGEATDRILFDECAAMQISAPGGGQCCASRDFPESVSSQTAERVLRVESLVGRPEALQQPPSEVSRCPGSEPDDSVPERPART